MASTSRHVANGKLEKDTCDVAEETVDSEPDYVDREDVLVQNRRLLNEIINSQDAQPRICQQRNQDERWQKPAEHWVKFNTDGAVGGSENMAAAGGFLRDAHGDWIFGFSRSLGICFVLNAELWAIHDALSYAWNNEFTKVEIETRDGKRAVGCDTPPPSSYPLNIFQSTTRPPPMMAHASICQRSGSTNVMETDCREHVVAELDC
ncbi:hypothetical protein F3Y22_tig00110556pilonHSYRG00057 [Hibiscus syriacus]|uniref:RNase H type-1 domain-containing protein n=1 Tax=Hibiscus syriacus TaxID=106335 RepID=A0A6A3ABA8_HIBSY|nr:hypothetical protein F3Y22_tig00110556pilonHSYRG00057 [Hibiscus syriacus]